MEIYFVRHTKTTVAGGICYGQSDVQVQEILPGQLDGVVKKILAEHVTLYTSPLQRCYCFAEYFRIHSGKSTVIKSDERLKEMNFGEWEMQRWDEINPVQLTKWMMDFVNEKVPGGESFMELNNRVKHFLYDIARTHSGQDETVVIIAHAGVIRSALCQVLEMPLRNAFKIPIDYGSITKIAVDEKSTCQNIHFINQI
jgi:alpha-ribazole phosphatase